MRSPTRFVLDIKIKHTPASSVAYVPCQVTMTNVGWKSTLFKDKRVVE